MAKSEHQKEGARATHRTRRTAAGRAARSIADAARRAGRACLVESLERRQFLSAAGSANFDPLDAAVNGFQFDYRNGVTTQADGKILIAGYVGTSGAGSGTDVAVARYNASGAIDFGYGSGGVAVLSLPGDQEGKGIALDPTSGKAVVAVRANNGATNGFAVARFTTAGLPDATFDTDGYATVTFNGGNENAAAIATRPDGRIVIGGAAQVSNSPTARYDFAIAQFTTAGLLDVTFDGDGKLTDNAIPGNSDQITGLVLQPADGKIVVSGSSAVSTTGDGSAFVVKRYDATGGTGDLTFNGGSAVVTTFGSGNVAGANSVTLQADGKIVVAGSVSNAVSGDSHFAVARYTATGLADNTFDGDGQATVSFGSSDIGGAVAMQNIGGLQRIVVAGSTGSHGSFAIARLNLDGSVDISFDGDGKVVTPVTFPGSEGVERVPGLAIETFPSPSHVSNIITVGVDVNNNLILASHSGGDSIFVDDEWTITNDTAPSGLSNGDTVTDLTTGITAIYGVDAFSTIPDGINAASAGGFIYVLGGSDKTFASGTFVLNDNKTIDLTDNALIIHGGSVGTWNGLSYTATTGQIAAGRHGGSWDRPGIITSVPSARGSAAFHTLGISSAAQTKGIANGDTAVWRGQTVTGSDVLIMFTYNGDATLDGKINIDDYGRIDFNVAIGGKGYANGDFNYDGTINIDDYGIIDFNIGIQGAPFFSAPGQVPLGSATSSSASAAPSVFARPADRKDDDGSSRSALDLLA